MPTTTIDPNQTYTVWFRTEDHYKIMSGSDLIEELKTNKAIVDWRLHDDRAPYY